MTQLAGFLKRFGPAYSEWLAQHDRFVAAKERAKIIEKLIQADKACSSWAVGVIEKDN